MDIKNIQMLQEVCDKKLLLKVKTFTVCLVFIHNKFVILAKRHSISSVTEDCWKNDISYFTKHQQYSYTVSMYRNADYSFAQLSLSIWA